MMSILNILYKVTNSNHTIERCCYLKHKRDKCEYANSTSNSVYLCLISF